MKLSEATKIVGGKLGREGSFENLGFAIHPLPRLLTWIESEKFVADAKRNSNVTAVIVAQGMGDALPRDWGFLEHENPRRAFYDLHNGLAANSEFYGAPTKSVIDRSAVVHPSAHVSEINVNVGPGVRIEPFVVLNAGTTLGEGAVVRSGAVIGSPGFQYLRNADGVLTVEHTGGVSLGRGTEVHANANINRAIFGGATIIGDDSKIDTLVHIAHNVIMGKRCLVCGCTDIAGSVVMGDDVYVGPGVTVTNCIRIGNRARLTLGSVVVGDVKEGEHVTGNWAVPHGKFFRSHIDHFYK